MLGECIPGQGEGKAADSLLRLYSNIIIAGGGSEIKVSRAGVARVLDPAGAGPAGACTRIARRSPRPFACRNGALLTATRAEWTRRQRVAKLSRVPR